MKNFDLTIAGELNLDLILYGLPAEMAMERELLATDFRATLGSSSAIVAHNVASLGAQVSFSTLTGQDDFGRMALERLRAARVDITRARTHPLLATGVTVLLPHGAERHILTYPGTIAKLQVCDLDFEFLIQARHFHLSSLYLQRGLHVGLPDLLRRLKDAGLTISLDTNDDPDNLWGAPLDEVLTFVDVFLPSESELCRMAGKADVDSAIRVFADRVPTIVVKRGRLGARLYEDGVSTDIEPIKIIPVDTVGAGDSFNSGFLRAHLLGKDSLTCTRAGNIAGALSTQAPGGTEAFADKNLRENFLRQHKFYELLT